MRKTIPLSILLVSVFCAFGFCWGSDYFQRSPNEGPARAILFKNVDSTYEQRLQPTDLQKSLGEKALRHWRIKSNDCLKGDLATDIVVGKALDNLPDASIVPLLGQPEYRSLDKLTYNVARGDEDFGYLVVEIEGGKVKKAYLHVAYLDW